MMRGKIVFALMVLSVLGCATTSDYELSGVSKPSGDYSEVLDNWTKEAKAYDSGAASFQVFATLRSPEIIHHQLYFDGKKNHRTPEQFTESLKQSREEDKSQTTFFLALYTDKDSNNDLDKQKSLWNVFLDVDGKRVMPKSVKRVFDNRVTLIDKYPYLNSWSRPYLIVFPVPLSQVTKQQVTLTLASSLGAAHLKYPK